MNCLDLAAKEFDLPCTDTHVANVLLALHIQEHTSDFVVLLIRALMCWLYIGVLSAQTAHR